MEALVDFSAYYNNPCFVAAAKSMFTGTSLNTVQYT